jgi:hypothetical protein
MPLLPGKIELEFPDQPFHIGEQVFSWKESRYQAGMSLNRPEPLGPHEAAQRLRQMASDIEAGITPVTRRARLLKIWGYRGKETRRSRVTVADLAGKG